ERHFGFYLLCLTGVLVAGWSAFGGGCAIGCSVIHDAVGRQTYRLFAATGILWWITVMLCCVGGWDEIMDVVLWGGMAVEGMLVGYQAYAARTFCALCMLFALLVAVANVVRGHRHAFRAVSLFLFTHAAMWILASTVATETVLRSQILKMFD
ncbi:hypothetical protein, partial [Desulfacinum hydrothermale]|uniref:hypothetical protein n=1 Tax=Desulfacinum hydrothermale TaxID=109258 RepID=UPI001BAF7D9E